MSSRSVPFIKIKFPSVFTEIERVEVFGFSETKRIRIVQAAICCQSKNSYTTLSLLHIVSKVLRTLVPGSVFIEEVSENDIIAGTFGAGTVQDTFVNWSSVCEMFAYVWVFICGEFISAK